MANYHLTVQNISRGQGRGVIAAAAYRHGAAMVDTSTGQSCSYEGRRDVVHSEFSVPSDAPAWVKDMRDDAGSVVGASEAFWNRLNEVETRKNARLAREIEFSLPRELSREQNIALAREFVSQTFLNDGMVADWAYHDKEGNPHIHVMLTNRPLTEDGFGSAWVPVLDPSTGEQLRGATGKLRSKRWAGDGERIVAYRKAWAEVQNRHLAMAGVDVRVTHESYRAQGIDAEPTRHLGPKGSAIRRKGERTIERDRLSPEAKAANRDLFLAEPEQVLRIITRERSVFDERDVARTVHRLVDDPEAFETIRLRVMASAEMVELAPRLEDAESGHELSRARYTTADMLDVETRMIERAADLRGEGGYAVAPALVEGAIDAKPYLAADQKAAIRAVTGTERIAAVVGFAGAGKSTMLAAAREAWEAQGYRVHGAALAGKATESLEQSSGIRSRTLASWEHAWANGRDRLGAGDVLVIDEAGMVASRQMERFVSAVEQAGAKLVLVGDAAQLQPIEAGAAFRAITEEIGYAELAGVRRQREEWAREASVSFAQGRVGDALDAYAGRGLIRFTDTREAARAEVLDGWMADRAKPGSTLILAHTNLDVFALNEGARERLKAQGRLTDEASFLTARGTRRFSAGDRVLFLENDRGLGVKNGMLGTVEAAETGRLVVAIDTENGPARTVELDQSTYSNVDWGYAATIHKSQGATVDRVRVLASPTMDRHLAYVAMSRHREGVVLHAGRDDFRDVVQLTAKLSRSGAKEVSTDYTRGARAERFAMRRGVVTGREVLPGVLAFARRQQARVAAMRVQLGELWSRAEAAIGAKRAAAASTTAPARKPKLTPMEQALRNAAIKQTQREQMRAQAATAATSARSEQESAKQALGATLTPVTTPAASHGASEQTLRRQPATGATQTISDEGSAVLIEPLREFDETISAVAKRTVFALPEYPAEERRVADLAGKAFTRPDVIVASIVLALDRTAPDFERQVGLIVEEAIGRGDLRGKTGLFASRADKDLRAAAHGFSQSLRRHATILHGWTHQRRQAATGTEEERRKGLGRAIPRPSERLSAVLDKLATASTSQRSVIVQQTLRDPVLGRELWGFAKAIGERFGAATEEAPDGAAEGILGALSHPDRNRIDRLRPIIEAGRLAAREVQSVEERREELRLARTVELNQSEGLSPGV